MKDIISDIDMILEKDKDKILGNFIRAIVVLS